MPLPFDAWQIYRPWVKKFCETFKAFPPGNDYEVWAACNWGEPTDEVREWFYGIKTRFVDYTMNGCDLGGHQFVASIAPIGALVVGMTSRVYFHRNGWLDRMLLAYNQFGGLIGCSASKQGASEPHLCTRGFMMSAEDWKAYPLLIDSRQKGPLFEVGTNNRHGSLLNWYLKNRGAVTVVHWDDTFELPQDWDRYVASKGRFRDGEQNAMLMHDFHSQQYAEASLEEKLKLEAMLKAENA